MKRKYEGVPAEVFDKACDTCWSLLVSDATNSRRLNGQARLTVKLAAIEGDRASGMVAIELCRSRVYRHYTDFAGNRFKLAARAKWQHTQKFNKLFKMLAPYRVPA